MWIDLLSGINIEWDLTNKYISLTSFTIISLNGNAFAHAEANQLNHDSIDLEMLVKEWEWCGMKCQFLPLKIENLNIKDKPIMLARTNDKDGGKEWENDIIPGIKALKEKVPNLNSYIHGHTVVKEETIRNIQLDDSQIKIVNCDLGATPFYRNLRFDSPYDPCVIPYLFEININWGA